MKGRKKLYSKSGFTLGEVLVAIIILLMMSTIVAAGVPLAKRAYDKVTVGANAEVLLSTTVTALRDQLGTAREVETPNNKTITYYNADTNSRSKLFLGDADETDIKKQGILLQPYNGDEWYLKDEVSGAGGVLSSGDWRLVSSAAATNGMYVTYDSVAYDNRNGLVTFTGLKVNWSLTTSTAPSIDSLVIRVIAAS